MGRLLRMGLAATCLAFAVGAAAAAEDRDAVKCEDVSSIGVATMDAKGVLSLELRSSDAEGVLVYHPGDKDYAGVLAHLGGMRPGDMKPVKPWC